MDIVRTPEERLEGLPDFPFESNYTEIDGLRLAGQVPGAVKRRLCILEA